ncbi:MAG: glycosyltransferase [bacterium]
MLSSISIIIPTYNRANYLKTLINQLLTQSQPPHEIIIVDDHSTDNTVNYLKNLTRQSPRVKYILNQGHHQRDAKKTGLKYATGEYIGFFDDDAEIEDNDFLARLIPHLNPGRVIQAKVILEQMGRVNRPDITWKDILATRPFPILELVTSNFNCGTKRRTIFPLIEWGNFWHHSLKDYFIDDNLIKDGYGESYSASLKLYRAGVKLLIEPSLVIRHIGAPTGGSHKFNKKNMLRDFTKFHYGYFYNMIYLHRRFFSRWVWLWLPFFVLKSLIALTINWNLKGWYEYAYKPIAAAGKTPEVAIPKLFVWQGAFRGGAEYITLSAAKHFSRQGLDVTLGVYKKNPSMPIKQIVFPEYKLIPQSFRSFINSLNFRLRYAKNFSAVYAHTLGAWKTKNNKVFIHDAADLDDKLSQTVSFWQKLAYRLWRFLYFHLSLKPATAIFSATPEFSSYLRRHGLGSKHIAPSGSFYNDRIHRYIKRTLPIRPIKLIFIGDYHSPAKNFSLVKKIFYKNNDYFVTITGGNQPYCDANFNYPGWLSPEELQAALAKSHIFFMPSTSEGFSIALLEALATGIPCLVNQSVIPSPLKTVSNIVPYQSVSEVLPKINTTINNYSHYNIFDPRLKQFAEETVLRKECNIIKRYVV